VKAIEPAVIEIVTGIWSAMLDLELVEGPQAVTAARQAQTERSMTACIQVTGTWEGSVLLYSTFSLARKMASIMFATPPEELSTEEIEDAIGELGNMAAGNIKKLLDGPCQISLPAVVNGVDYRLLVPGSRVWCKVLLDCEGEPVLVTVLEKRESSVRAAHQRAGLDEVVATRSP
jgi:chemotaxis protein CheX